MEKNQQIECLLNILKNADGLTRLNIIEYMAFLMDSETLSSVMFYVSQII